MVIHKEFRETERFSIKRRLGEGGFGVVYQVYDNKNSSLVALKVLHQGDAEALYRFKKEFRILLDISHPNLVMLYELFSDKEQWFFTMEFIEGVNFLEYVRGAKKTSLNQAPTLESLQSVLNTVKHPTSSELETLKLSDDVKQTQVNSNSSLSSNTLDIEALRITLKQLVEGLLALHQSGKLHRDIKPSNVFVKNNGQVKILDFGLATELASEGTYQSQNIVGTPAYMSPEQARGRPVSNATDWYSVGVILYEALTGQLPFKGQVFEVLMNKQTTQPPPPNKLAPNIPEDLNSLCLDLLQPNPEKRPSGREILDRLGKGLSPTIYSQVLKSRLIGRERHLAQLETAFKKVDQGQPTIAYVYGCSGIGKTYLIRYFLEQLQQREPEIVLLEGRCYEQESVPYKALDSVIDALSQYLKHLSPLEAEAILPIDILALARLFPVLRQVESVSKGRRKVLEIPDSQELRRRAFAALRELLMRLSNKKTLVIFIDDLQWGDVDSAALIGELLRPPTPPSFLLIGSYRSEEIDTSPFLQTLMHQFDEVTVEVLKIAVEELSSKEAMEVTQALLGEKCSMARAKMIALESSGNPFFISELIWYLREATHQDSIEKNLELETALPVETTLEDVIEARILRLPEGARRLLEIVALSGQPLDWNIAKRAAKFGSEDQEMLAVLRSNHLVRKRKSITSDDIETYHDRIRETVVKLISKENLKNYHHNLALSLESASKVDPERLVIHFQGAGELTKAAEYAIASAEQATEALAFDRAARLYQVALELHSSKDSKFHSLQLKLGDALVNAGYGSEAAKVYLAAANQANTTESLELHRRAAEQFLHSGYIDKGIEILQVVLKSIDMKLAKTPKLALVSFLIRRTEIQLRGLKFVERDEKQIPIEKLISIDICWSAAGGLCMVDTIHGLDFQTRHLLLALKAGEPYRIARALALEIGFCSLSGGRTKKRTETLIQFVKPLVDRLSNPHALGLFELEVGLAAFMEGRWKHACEHTERAALIFRERCTGVAWELDTAYLFLLSALYRLGNLNGLAERLPTLLKNAQKRGDPWAEFNLRVPISHMMHLIADNVELAERDLKQAMERWSQREFQVQHYWALLAEIQIALYTNRGLDAWNLMVDRWPAIKRSLLLRIQYIYIDILHLRARSAIAAAVDASNFETLLGEAERDAKKIEQEKMSWSNAIVPLIRAGIATCRGKNEEAIKLLTMAEIGFEAVEMSLYATASRYRRGQLIGGEQGRKLIENASNWMAEQKIKKPNQLLGVLAPGKWPA